MSGPSRVARFGNTELPPEQEAALRRARRLEWVSLAFLTSGVVVVYLVMGNSQAMKVAWIEDLLSLIPPLAFLLATRRAGRRPSVSHPYGHHRVVGSAHLTAAVALLSMGLFLVFDSGSGLLAGEHPPIGTVQLFGQTVWTGWLMIAAMVYTGVFPVILGRRKLPLARDLHDKVLYADADMNKADWMTAAAAIVGVLGIAYGVWWLDAVAALVIAGSILHDGVSQLRGAVRDLLDGEARTFDDSDVHPVVDDILEAAHSRAWVDRAGCRVRDQGHVFHTEVFVVPVGPLGAEQCDELAEAIGRLDWKLDDVVVAPVGALPPGVRTRPRAATES
ncbi:cation diffusion facilitator family transporter [Propioniciclava soli]|uniref:cation diffusion facilitator family transporter n=1 Tax=Propioniciclava soli TaxID=2775081 RepID=UPI001E3CFEA2